MYQTLGCHYFEKQRLTQHLVKTDNDCQLLYHPAYYLGLNLEQILALERDDAQTGVNISAAQQCLAAA